MMTNPFSSAIQQHSGKDPSDEDQQRLGSPRADGGMTDEHTRFLDLVLRLLDEKTIDPTNPKSFVKKDIYDALPETMQGKIDLAIPNIVSLLERIVDLHARPEQDDSFEMKNLIETLWQAKERIEKDADVFIF